MSKLYFLDRHGGLWVTCPTGEEGAKAFGPLGTSRPAENIELGIFCTDHLVGAEAVEASPDHRIIENELGWRIVVTRVCELPGEGVLWDEDPSGDGPDSFWLCGPGGARRARQEDNWLRVEDGTWVHFP